ncbi:M48 family metallopeptidase [Microbulbifer sediminum]|uniref:M48 family metallopeptidase n=1 Tax=Microbulbifer sediminum TaxID=2904250 RepID=UPI001F369E64|nr:M48 family metallopeptidase [Microbulbifer sediminum]
MLTIPGRWQDGATSTETPASLEVRGELVRLYVEGQELCAARPGNLAFSPRLGRTPRYISFPQLAGQFETRAHDLVEKLESLDRRKASLVYRFIHRIEQNLLMVALATLVVVALVWGYFAWGVPTASRVVAERLPAGLLDEAAEETLELMSEHYLEPSELTEARRREVRAVVGEMAPAYPLEKLHFFKGGSTTGANAFALPDGTIVFTDELVALAESEDEIAAIFGHELAHVLRRHSLRQVIQGSAISLTIALFTGEVSALGDLILTAPVVFARLSYSRQFELESDEYALALLHERGMDPDAFVSILTKLHESHRPCPAGESCDGEGEGSGWTSYLSTHPHLEQRIALALQD